MPDFYIIAGPNGAGKTIAAFTILPELLNVKEFINADEIARGISPFNIESCVNTIIIAVLQSFRQSILP